MYNAKYKGKKCEVNKLPKVLPNITYDNECGQNTVDSPSSMYKLPFEKDDEYFSNLEDAQRAFERISDMMVDDDEDYVIKMTYFTCL